MKIILSRHGNTFAGTQSAYWIGRYQDLPLQPAGVAQAAQLAMALKEANVTLQGIYAGPLQRTLGYARIVLSELQLPLDVQIDHRLNELDYGGWAGLTTAEICRVFGRDEWKHWEQLTRWPRCSQWQDTYNTIMQEMAAFIHHVHESHCATDTILVVSSAGKLRCLLAFLLTLPQGAAITWPVSAKVSTGHVCQLSLHNQVWQLDYWNVFPHAALFHSLSQGQAKNS